VRRVTVGYVRKTTSCFANLSYMPASSRAPSFGRRRRAGLTPCIIFILIGARHGAGHARLRIWLLACPHTCHSQSTYSIQNRARVGARHKLLYILHRTSVNHTHEYIRQNYFTYLSRGLTHLANSSRQQEGTQLSTSMAPTRCQTTLTLRPAHQHKTTTCL
jgi:hypothetical protein